LQNDCRSASLSWHKEINAIRFDLVLDRAKPMSTLTQEELNVVLALQQSGMDIAVATLAVVMATREHTRPEAALVDIVRRYTFLEDQATAAQAIATLKEMGWLTQSNSKYGPILVHQAADLRGKIARRIGDPGVTGRLAQLRSILEPNVHILGPMSEREVYESYLYRLRQAQREICLPMMAQSPREGAVPILQERAGQNVKVRVLVAAPDVVVRLWGEALEGRAREVMAGWVQNAAGYQSFEVRICHSAEAMRLATCVGIDHRVVRYDVYDVSRQRTLEGVMIEVESPPGFNLNLVDLFYQEFEEAWARSEPLGFFGRVRWRFGRYWQWWLSLLFLGLTITTFRTPTISGVLGSIAATFLVNAMVTSREELVNILRRLRNDK
jgi:hypothetical protein